MNAYALNFMPAALSVLSNYVLGVISYKDVLVQPIQLLVDKISGALGSYPVEGALPTGSLPVCLSLGYPMKKGP